MYENVQNKLCIVIYQVNDFFFGTALGDLCGKSLFYVMLIKKNKADQLGTIITRVRVVFIIFVLFILFICFNELKASIMCIN